MGSPHRFGWNISSSWIGILIQLAVVMLLTPFVLRELGGSRFGVWALITSITGYYGLLDAGARVSIGRGIARYWTLRDWHRMNRVASAGLAVLLSCAAVVLLLTVAGAALAPFAFDLPRDLAPEFRWCFLLVGASVAAQFCLFVHSAALGAVQRYDLANASQIVTQVLYACGVPVVLSWGGGLVGLAAWLGTTNLMSYVLRWRFARRVLPELRLSVRLVDRSGLAEFAHFGIWQLLVNLAQQVIACSDAIVIAAAVNTTAVAPFHLAARVARYFAHIFAPVGNVLFPATVRLDATGGTEEIRRLYLRGSRLLWLLSIGLGFLAVTWSPEFFAQWVGDRQPGFGGRISELFGVLLLAAAVTAPQQVSLPMFLALGRQHVLATLLVLEAASNVVLSLLLVHRYGLVGIAWGTCLPAVLFQGFLHPLFACRMLDVPLLTYGRESLLRPILLGATLAVLSRLRPASLAAGWLPLLSAGVVTAAMIVILGTIIGLDRADRVQFLYAPLQRLKQRLLADQSIRGATVREPRASTIGPHD